MWWLSFKSLCIITWWYMSSLPPWNNNWDPCYSDLQAEDNCSVVRRVALQLRERTQYLTSENATLRSRVADLERVSMVQFAGPAFSQIRCVETSYWGDMDNNNIMVVILPCWGQVWPIQILITRQPAETLGIASTGFMYEQSESQVVGMHITLYFPLLCHLLMLKIHFSSSVWISVPCERVQAREVLL